MEERIERRKILAPGRRKDRNKGKASAKKQGEMGEALEVYTGG